MVANTDEQIIVLRPGSHVTILDELHATVVEIFIADGCIDYSCMWLVGTEVKTHRFPAFMVKPADDTRGITLGFR